MAFPDAQLQQAAQALHSRLARGEDAEEDAKHFVRAGGAGRVPDPLILACLGDRGGKTRPCPMALRALLEGRGNPNAVDKTTSAPAIHAACWHGSVEVVKLLLDYRADIEIPEDRMKTPPLNTALAAGNAKVALELLNRQADVQWKHHDGATALHVAMAWIASSHNSQLRLPPVGEEPRAVVAMMLHNGVDPTLTEGMARSSMRGTGMTPLESFRRDIARSPWRSDPEIGPKFDRTAKMIHTLLEQGEAAMKLKLQGNEAFTKQGRCEDALKSWTEGRCIWEAADIRGHHVAVLWSNAASAYRKMGDLERWRHACEQGVTHYCTQKIKSKLEASFKECKEAEANRDAWEKEREEQRALAMERAAQRPPPTKLKEKFIEGAEEPLYGPEGSHQGKVENPGPFICDFEEAKEAGFVDGVPGWRERATKEDEELDKELVRTGMMSKDLL